MTQLQSSPSGLVPSPPSAMLNASPPNNIGGVASMSSVPRRGDYRRSSDDEMPVYHSAGDVSEDGENHHDAEIFLMISRVF